VEHRERAIHGLGGGAREARWLVGGLVGEAVGAPVDGDDGGVEDVGGFDGLLGAHVLVGHEPAGGVGADGQ